MPTKNISFLVALTRIALRRGSRELIAPIVVLSLGVSAAVAVINNTAVSTFVEGLSAGQQEMIDSIRSFDDILQDLLDPGYFQRPLPEPIIKIV